MYDDTKLCRWYDCSASVKQRRSLDPASASNKTVVEYLATVSPELELANGSLRKACLTKLEKAANYVATAENISCERSLPSVCKPRSRAQLPTLGLPM